MHLNTVEAVSFAYMTLPRSKIETEGPHGKSTHFCIVLFGEEFADLRKQIGIGGRVGAGGLTDRFLVYVDEPFDITNTSDGFIFR